MNENKRHFGRELFEQVMRCKTYPYNRIRVGPLSGLTDHGFVADRACLWSDALEGHEYAVIARTYCGNVEIDSPPFGIKCVRLPALVMGDDEPGVPVALVVTSKSERSQELLSGYLQLPAEVIAHAIPTEMSASGWAVCLPVIGGVLEYPKILKIGRPW